MLRAPFRFRQIPYSLPTFTTVTLRHFNHYHGHMEATEQQIIQSEQVEAVAETQEEPKRGTRFEAKIIKTSRTVSYLLRHGAKREGLSMRPDGYVKVEELVRSLFCEHVDSYALLVKTQKAQRIQLYGTRTDGQGGR